MRKNNLLAIVLVFVFVSCSTEENPTEEVPQASENLGYNMLLIGNSFFKPYAEKLNEIAPVSGFENHHGTTIFRGGDNGRPINFWNDSTSAVHRDIKVALDQGNLDFFGMTAGKLPDNPTDGFKQWIEYALQSNPNITVFLSIPPPDFPENWEALAQSLGFDSIQEAYANFVSESIHNNLVEQLRAEFPNTSIFTIPTGWAAINLAQMNLDNLLLDNIDLLGPLETSIFTDAKGHQGEIVRQTGGLLWLHSIYGTDLSTHNYQTGFDTDLHGLAADIMNNHDPNYKR